jgi:hypothetical protein
MEHDRRHNDEAILEAINSLRELGQRTYEQTVKTNGRVTKVEQEVEILKIINAGEEGKRTAMRPFFTVVMSVIGSILAAIGINYAIK